jgi:hypothetical protein
MGLCDACRCRLVETGSTDALVVTRFPVTDDNAGTPHDHDLSMPRIVRTSTSTSIDRRLYCRISSDRPTITVVYNHTHIYSKSAALESSGVSPDTIAFYDVCVIVVPSLLLIAGSPTDDSSLASFGRWND